MQDFRKLEFGTGSFVGDYLHQDMEILSERDQARALGWADGCPVALDLTDPSNPAPGRGPENMINRYGEVNFWFTQIVREVAEVNPSLADQLKQHVYRQSDEPVGLHEPESVPEEYYEQMAPMNTLAGFALPRLFTANLHAAGDDREIMQQRMHDGLDVVTAAAQETEDPLALLAVIAGEFSNRKFLSDEAILKSVLASGWMKEHNGRHTVTEFKKQLEERAPELYAHYTAISADERALLKLS